MRQPQPRGHRPQPSLRSCIWLRTAFTTRRASGLEPEMPEECNDIIVAPSECFLICKMKQVQRPRFKTVHFIRVKRIKNISTPVRCKYKKGGSFSQPWSHEIPSGTPSEARCWRSSRARTARCWEAIRTRFLFRDSVCQSGFAESNRRRGFRQCQHQRRGNKFYRLRK